MNFALLFPLLLLVDPVPLPLELQEEEIGRVGELAEKCSEATDFEPLFILSSSKTVTGAHTTEELSEINEEVFLKCPLLFLRALKSQPDETVDSVLDYFGVRHPPWELGAELQKWEGHEEVGKFVRARFKGYLEAEEPK